MDSDILVKPQLRPCLANGKKAFFHRWVESEELFISIDLSLPYEERMIVDKMLCERLRSGERLLPPDTKVNTQKRLYALVEYENGKCELENIQNVRFLDSGALFYEQGWPDDEEFY